jgi:hypothetical protein
LRAYFIELEGEQSLETLIATHHSSNYQPGTAVIEYEGERTLEDLTKFIKEKAKIKFDLKIEEESTSDAEKDAPKEEEEKKDEL